MTCLHHPPAAQLAVFHVPTAPMSWCILHLCHPSKRHTLMVNPLTVDPQVLTINQVVDILVKYAACKDWATALQQVVPNRKVVHTVGGTTSSATPPPEDAEDQAAAEQEEGSPCSPPAEAAPAAAAAEEEATDEGES